MGLSFAGRAFQGADAPPLRGRRAAWVQFRHRWGRSTVWGLAAALVLVTLGVIGVTVSSAVPLWTYLTGPFVFVLLPGDFVASVLPVPPPYSLYLGLVLSLLLWTTVVARLLRPHLADGIARRHSG